LTKISVFIADDHPVVRDGLVTFLSKFDDLDVVGTAGDGSAVLEQVRTLHPDVVLTDIRMPGMNGIELARRLRLAHPQMRIIIFTTYDDEEYLYDALRTGAQAYLLKSISHDVLASAIRSVHAGERLLSPPLMDKTLNRFEKLARFKIQHDIGLVDDEMRILHALESGASNRHIAEKLFWSEATVKRKLQDIFAKLDVDNRVKAVAEGIRRGLI